MDTPRLQQPAAVQHPAKLDIRSRLLQVQQEQAAAKVAELKELAALLDFVWAAAHLVLPNLGLRAYRYW